MHFGEEDHTSDDASFPVSGYLMSLFLIGGDDNLDHWIQVSPGFLHSKVALVIGKLVFL